MKERQQERALLAARADVTQYTIWHKSHTAPVIARGGMALKLLRVDVDALGDYVGRLSSLYYRLGLWEDWPAALVQLRENIQHPWWQRKIGYYSAVYHLAPGGDRTVARRELSKLAPITHDEDDLDVLHLFVDLELSELPFSERIAILDRVLSLSKERENQLQYRGAKAIQYFLIGDEKSAEQQLIEVLEIVRQSQAEDPLGSYERHLFGAMLQLLGSLRGDKGMLKESVSCFRALLREGGWMERGEAVIHRQIGDSYRYAGEWQLAEREYRDALALGGLELDRVHLAECLLHMQKVALATSEIDGVERERLERREFDDFVFGFAGVALASGDRERLAEAKTLLHGLKTSEPLFNEQRLKLLVRLADALLAAGSSSAADQNTSPSGMATASSFLLLQPNLFGFGINFNAIIDYLARRKPRDS